MTHLQAYKKDLYDLRFSPMWKPANEVAGLTQLESHSTRSRVMMMWRIAEGIISWGRRDVELLYQSTLDSISEAFDIFHYPVSQYMLAARADVWEAGLAPQVVKQAVSRQTRAGGAPQANIILLAGEIAQLGDEALLKPLQAALQASDVNASVWLADTGAVAYAMGAWEAAREQAGQIRAGLESSGARTVIADGPETAWALTKIYPALEVDLPEGVRVKLLSEALAERLPDGTTPAEDLSPVFVHDSRPACLIAEEMANNLAVMPGYVEDESVFGGGPVYEAPRRLVDKLGAQRAPGKWIRSLAKTSGADDGLWLTYPDLAAGLARQRLAYARELGVQTLVTDSPLAASFLSRHAGDGDVRVKLLAELFA